MRNLILSALILASAFQTAMGQTTVGAWTYIVENDGATITRSTATGAVTIPSELGGYAVKKVGNTWPPIFGTPNTSVTSVTIPSSVTSIGSNAFAQCTGLTSITIPNSVTSIVDRAFANCTGLTSVTIPSSVSSIPAYAFAGCTSLTSITIPNSVTSIVDWAFANCTGLASVTIPNSVTSIGRYAFYDCTGLTSVTIPNSVTSIGQGMFYGCTGLTSVTIPNSVTSIGQDAFIGTGLTSITIPNSVTSIGQDAFNGTGLTSITIPNSVTSIGENAFYQCHALRSVIIGNGVTSIGRGAFLNCSGLTNVSMGSSVTSIGDLAFLGTLLNSILLPSTHTIVGANAFPESTTILHLNQLSALAIDPTFCTALASNSAFVTALANNPAFVFALVNSIKATSDNYGFATQSGLSSAIEPLATKTQITTAINEGKAAGIASVTASPNTWSLFTTSQIQNMAVGDLVLTRQVGGDFLLNYDIEQSTDLQTWTPYQALSLPLTGLPTDKAFVRIKAKQ